jgi:hypothetical protein
MMKRFGAATILCMLIFVFLGCSSTPPGTVSIGDVQKKGAEQLGQNIVVVGTAETRTSMTSFRLFKIYDGGNFLWVALPEGSEMPPQGLKVRASGALQQKEFTVIGKTIYIEATKVSME